MSILPEIRRIVTGHDPNGIAVVQSDISLPFTVVVSLSSFSNALALKQPSILLKINVVKEVANIKSSQIWVSDCVPAKENNEDFIDASSRLPLDDANFRLVHINGTNLRGTDLAPGGVVPMHRTSSVDYNILTQGELVLITEDGKETHLKNLGDVVIQRGTLHAWKNPNEKEWARWVTVLVAADPAVVHGSALDPVFRMG